MPVSRGRKGVEQEMRKFGEGTLHSGSKKGPVVTSRKQAIAISLSEAGMSKRKKHAKTELRRSKPRKHEDTHAYVGGKRV